MRSPLWSSSSLALIVGLALMAAARAETIAITCEANGPAGPMTLSYDGDATGTLTVKADFGEAQIPASKETRSEGGTSVTGFRAFGRATVAMPDPKALEACVAGKGTEEQRQDEDIVTLFLQGCMAETPLGGPTEIDMTVEMAIMEPPGVYVYVIRKFVEESTLPVGRITVESFPPPNCSLASP